MMLALRRAFALSALLLAAVGFTRAAFGASSGDVMVIPIHGTVDEGMAHMVARAVATANAEHAKAVVLDVDSPGGLVSAAFEIRDAIFDSKAPTYAFVSRRAYSAAALISLSAQHIVMAPGASIGAAEPIPPTAKMISALRAEFASTAQRNHHDPLLAGAMVDKTIDAPDYKRPNGILTLDTQDALRSHIADATAPSFSAAMRDENLSGFTADAATYTWGEKIARFATSPEVSGILLTIGLLGLLIEMQTLHGIAGFVGVVALTLFFGAHIYAGFSDWIVVLLAVVGLCAILFELHLVPGHGLPGALGAVLLIVASLLAFGIAFYSVAIETLATAIVLSVVLFVMFVRAYPENAWYKRVALLTVQGPDYVASMDHRALLGRSGTAATYLRPAGMADIDGERVDVLTAGEFIAQGTPITIVRVEGARIFVEPL